MITKQKLIAAGADKLASILLSLYQNETQLRGQFDIIFSELDEVSNTTEVMSNTMVDMIKKDIASLKQPSRFFNYRQPSRFFDYYAADAAADFLDEIRLHIADDVLSESPQLALDLMLSFFDVYDDIVEQVDDDNGVVTDVLIEACVDLANICKHIQMPITDLVDLVFTRLMSNEYGIDGLISNFQDLLQEAGLKLLQEKFEQSVNTHHSWRIGSSLKCIADCQKDVDSYIRACSLRGEPSLSDHIDISKRLIEHGRIKEALQWLDKVDVSCDYIYRKDLYNLKTQALELNGDYEGAQNERLAWFQSNLKAQIYQDILQHAEPAFKVSFRQDAIQKALELSDPHTTLTFLTEIKELEESDKFVRLKMDQLDAEKGYNLRPAANVLRNSHPLTATLLYRKMIQSVLEGAKSSSYDYAAADLIACGLLNPQITEWGDYPPHDEYLATLKQIHKRKTRFWATYQSALKSQASKGQGD